MNSSTTAIIVAYKSNWIIENCIKSIEKKVKIIVVENSNDLKSKKFLEKKYKNLKVIINNNNGFGNAANIGALKAKTKYLLFLGPDTTLEKNGINKFIKIAKSFANNFGAILASDFNKKVKKIFEIKKNREAGVIFIKKDIFLEVGMFDENIFLYYEDNDLLERLLKKNQKIYETPIQYKHSYGSHDKKYHQQVEISRHWHFMWSMFYFYKKKNYIFAVFYTLPILIRCFFRLSINYLLNKKKYLIYKARFEGLLNSYLNKKSWFRPKIN
jgi:N-acetylglucosaminyl-diphospho-decaprenol L-rhamnosyltransferase